jgi:hypothetical protein
MSLICQLHVQHFEKSLKMVRNRTTETRSPTPETARSDAPDVGDGAVSGIAGALGGVYAALAGFTFRKFENFSDRRAEARAARKRGRSRSASVQARRDLVKPGART